MSGSLVGVFFPSDYAGLVFGRRDLPQGRETFQFNCLDVMGDLAALFHLLSAELDGLGTLSGASLLQLLGNHPGGLFEVIVVPA
ncbi:hypothetical protein [Streptomyces lydicus]|uniref:hypothetical protein n=1 Tax=Streptomyces lydicus TaxID=47763 RepID=UPI0033281D9E